MRIKLSLYNLLFARFIMLKIRFFCDGNALIIIVPYIFISIHIHTYINAPDKCSCKRVQSTTTCYIIPVFKLDNSTFFNCKFSTTDNYSQILTNWASQKYTQVLEMMDILKKTNHIVRQDHSRITFILFSLNCIFGASSFDNLSMAYRRR